MCWLHWFHPCGQEVGPEPPSSLLFRVGPHKGWLDLYDSCIDAPKPASLSCLSLARKLLGTAWQKASWNLLKTPAGHSVFSFYLGLFVLASNTPVQETRTPNLVNLCPLLVTLNPFGFGVNWPWMTQLADFESLTMWPWVAFCDSAKMLSEWLLAASAALENFSLHSRVLVWQKQFLPQSDHAHLHVTIFGWFDWMLKETVGMVFIPTLIG